MPAQPGRPVPALPLPAVAPALMALIESDAAAPTLTATEPVSVMPPPVIVAVTTAEPCDTPVIKPVELTVAIAGVSDVQVTGSAVKPGESVWVAVACALWPG